MIESKDIYKLRKYLSPIYKDNLKLFLKADMDGVSDMDIDLKDRLITVHVDDTCENKNAVVTYLLNQLCEFVCEYDMQCDVPEEFLPTFRYAILNPYLYTDQYIVGNTITIRF